MDRYTLIGGNASPYSLKMRAHMHYRRLPYNWILRTEENDHLLEGLRPVLVPVLQLPEDGSLHLDSTRLIYMLEDRHPENRSVIPDHPAHAFLAHLIEDMADEWVTKMMFHYRWAYEADIHYAARWIADDRAPAATEEEREKYAKFFTDRQIGRMPIVGCTPENAPIIEAGFHHILALLNADVGQYKYLFGTRPSIADFGLYGQLRTLSIDPTPMSIMRDEAQRAESWLRQLDDASGIEGDWYELGDLPPMTKGMIAYSAEVYLPFLAANAAAIDKGAETFSVELEGRLYSQGVFKYQVKCLGELKARYNALPEAAKDIVGGLIGEAGVKILR
ncbi:glutathione S-transferase [Sneathiella chungangensis]|uniref:Glutathione S-transferase n=1 Tax=Sneathiella chungangensis TaxID=1418234 RepID=A0A845MEP0_9PROT|nr:glutathione S-transferase family protein [Sneathiella chungangensis]MZR22145.1 glutathione S-transferase [Sneathiella chungangensis]